MALLQQHLAELTHLHRRLTQARTINPGERHQAAQASAQAAQRYAEQVATLLAHHHTMPELGSHRSPAA